MKFFIFSLFSFNYPLFYQIDRDTSFEVQVAEIVKEQEMWDPTVGTGYAENYYGYNPVIHFVMAYLSIITGLKVSFIAKYFLLIFIRELIFLIIYIILNNIFS